MAIALSAEYGDISLAGSVLIGSSCRARNPARRSHGPNGARSPMSPMPQSCAERSENRGRTTPAARPRCGRGIIQSTRSGARHGRKQPADRVAEDIRPRQQADDTVALAREVEEVAGMYKHVLFFEQPDDALVFRHRVRYPNHRRPSALSSQDLAG